MKLRVRKTHPAAILPTYATDGAGCFDLYAAAFEGGRGIEAIHKDRAVIGDTGLAFEVPPGYVLRIASRSGLAFNHGVEAFPGVIDSDYRGSVKVLLRQVSRVHGDGVSLVLRPGMRIAQAYLQAVPRVEFEEVEELSATTRGEGGFGSTGK